jgi:hypothetical protein
VSISSSKRALIHKLHIYLFVVLVLVWDNKEFGIIWQSVEPTWDGADRVRHFEERNEENWYSPRCMTNKPQKCVTFESERYDLKLKLLFLNCKTIFHRHFTKLNNIDNTPGCSRNTVLWIREFMLHCRGSYYMWEAESMPYLKAQNLIKSVLHFVGL